jgi:hypothetical protein
MLAFFCCLHANNIHPDVDITPNTKTQVNMISNVRSMYISYISGLTMEHTPSIIISGNAEPIAKKLVIYMLKLSL